MGGTRGRGGMLVWAVSAMLSAAAACGGAHDHPDGPKAPGKGGAPGNAGGGGAAGAAGAGGSPVGANVVINSRMGFTGLGGPNHQPEVGIHLKGAVTGERRRGSFCAARVAGAPRAAS